MIYQTRQLRPQGKQGEICPTISYAKEKLQAKYIFPFFTRKLKIVCLMVDTKDKGLLFIKPVYFRYKLISYVIPTFVCYQAVKEIPPATIITNQLLKDAYHFDPWWILKKRDIISPELREVVKQTNIAGMKLTGSPRGLTVRRDGKKITDICFNDSLTLIEGIKVKISFFSSELIDRNDLLLNKPVFEK